MSNFTEALGVDIGAKRIGLARVNSIARITQPVITIVMSELAPQQIKEIASKENADVVVVGIPIPQSGKDSDQTLYCRDFAGKLKAIGMNVVLQDETLSTNAAEDLLKDRRYSKNSQGDKPGIDELAACVILNDFLTEN